MNVQIQSVKFDADRKLVEFVEHKMDKLDRFVERAIGADVILKLDKDHELGNKVATINLHIPGDDLVTHLAGELVINGMSRTCSNNTSFNWFTNQC